MTARAALLALLLAPAAAPAAAQGAPAADAGAVRACLEGAAPYDAAPACIGAAADACQAGPDGASTMGIVACLSSEADAWDAHLNDEYGRLRERLRGADAAGPGAISRGDALRDAQRAWIAFRDADCALAHAIWQDGTIRGPVAASCRLEHTARRALALRDLRRDGEGNLR